MILLTIGSLLFSSPVFAQSNQGNCRAPGAGCGDEDGNQCCSIADRDGDGFKKGDPLTCVEGKCIVNKTLGEGDSCEGDQTNDKKPEGGIGQTTFGGVGSTERITSTKVCGGDLICNTQTKKCERNDKCIKPGQNDKTACEHDTSSSEGIQDSEADKTCCGGFKCQSGKCVPDASKKNTCLTDKDTEGNPPRVEAKGDYTTNAYKDGDLEENEVCCAKFQQWDFKGKHGERGSKCYSRETNKFCKKEGQEAKGDATTKDKMAPDEKCCAGLRLIDGKCTKEIACVEEDGKCTVGSFKCCGEMSCIIPENAKPDKDGKFKGKCMEGLPIPPSPPCAEGEFKDGKCAAVPTAFGKISTDPEGFIRSMFAVLLSLSGGIALLLIMKSGYLIMTANGKPEAIQSGRDQLIAAIVGLIFLIFSFVILQVIGFEILKIPNNKIN